MATVMPTDGQQEMYDIIVSQISPYKLDPDAESQLWSIVNDAFDRWMNDDPKRTRNLETKENLVELGTRIREDAEQNGLTAGSEITSGVIEAILSLLCPGFYPFC